jgi:hypothetical protein
MAKWGRRRTSGLTKAAETVGAGLGRLAAKYDAFMKMRAELAADLHEYASKTQKMLSDIGDTAAVSIQQAKKERPYVTKTVSKVKRRFSKALRARLAASAKARWAAAKKAGRNRLG